MSYTVEFPTEVSCKIHFNFSEDEVVKAITATLREYANDLKLDGFRKGKVPLQVIEKRFKEEAYSRTREVLVNQNLQNALSEENLSPVNSIQFEDEENLPEIKRGEGFSATCFFEVMPKIELPADFSEFSVDLDEVKVSDEDVENAVKALMQYYSTLEDVEEARKPEVGDVLVVDVEGSLDGYVVRCMSAQNFLMQLNDETKSKEIETLVQSILPGGETNGSMVCPDDYPHEEYRGKEIELTVRLHKIQKQITPALDDEFVKKMGFENVDSFKELLAKNTLNEKNNLAKNKAQESLMAKILESYDYPLPESMLQAALSNFMMQARQQIAKQQDMDPEMMIKVLADMKARGEESAKKDTKAHIFLLKIAEKYSFEVQHNDVHAYARQLAMQTGQEFEKVLERIYKTDMLKEIRERILAGKALDLIFEQSQKNIVDENGNPVPKAE